MGWKERCQCSYDEFGWRRYGSKWAINRMTFRVVSGRVELDRLESQRISTKLHMPNSNLSSCCHRVCCCHCPRACVSRYTQVLLVVCCLSLATIAGVSSTQMKKKYIGNPREDFCFNEKLTRKKKSFCKTT